MAEGTAMKLDFIRTENGKAQRLPLNRNMDVT